MLKVILSAIVSLGVASFAFAEGTETAPAPTGTEMNKAEKTVEKKEMTKETKTEKKHKAKKAH